MVMEGAVDIIQFMPGDPGFQYFEEVLQHIYAPDDLRLQQREQINYAYLQACLVAMQDGVPAGRLCVYLNPAIRYDGNPVMLFGNFECVDDVAVCRALMDEVERIAAEHQCACVIGPMNGSTWEDYRISLSCTGQHFFTDLLMPDYYHALLEQSGYQIQERYYSCISGVKYDLVIDQSHVQYLADNNVRVRNIDLAAFEDELSNVYKLSSEAFTGNAFYSPISEADFIKKYAAIKPYVDPDFVFLAEHNGELVGFLFCYPDLFARDKKRLVVKTMARLPNCKVKGIIDYMIQLMQLKAAEKGSDELIHAFIHEQNKSFRISDRYDGEVFHTYALMIKEVNH